MSRERVSTVVAWALAFLFLALLVGVQRAERRSLQARAAAARSTGVLPEAPPATSGGTLALQERM